MEFNDNNKWLEKIEADLKTELSKFSSINDFDDSKEIFDNIRRITDPAIEFLLGASERHKREREKVKISDFL